MGCEFWNFWERSSKMFQKVKKFQDSNNSLVFKKNPNILPKFAKLVQKKPKCSKLSSVVTWTTLVSFGLASDIWAEYWAFLNSGGSFPSWTWTITWASSVSLPIIEKTNGQSCPMGCEFWNFWLKLNYFKKQQKLVLTFPYLR